VSKRFPIHVRTVTGLEGVLADELRALGGREVEPKNRVVFCQGDLAFLYKANLWCRTAIRILRPLHSFPAPDENSLYRGIQSIDWSPWLSKSGTVAIDGHVRSSFTTHSLYIAQLAKDAVVDQFRERTGVRPSVDLKQPDLRIVVSLFENFAQVFVDSSGESLHKRGYRQKAGEAPLSETLAAGILKIAKWDGTTPLLDPMCGSGTFGIEAGLMLRNIAPGLFRKHFGFQRWADYDRPLFERLVSEARGAIDKTARVPIISFDVNPEMVDIARDNVERAGLTDLLRIERADFFTWDGLPETPGTIVMNPPYDERLAVEDMAEFSSRMGSRFKEKYSGWKAFVLSGNPDAIKYFGLRSNRRTPLFNGALECRLLEYDIHTETERGPRRAPPISPEQFILRVNPKWKEKAEIFANRLRKNQKHCAKWVRREGITCWRVYDKDIPELAFMLDVYGEYLHFAEIPRNHEHSASEHASYMKLMVRTAAETLGIAPEKVFFKVRMAQKPGEGQKEAFFEVTEGGHRFLVNLEDYVDVGLFLEYRKARALVEKEVSGKDFLNLYSYTGAFTVYAAAGGAKSTTSVDSTQAYLNWAGKNLSANQFAGPQHHLVQADVFEFLDTTTMTFDVCVVDPPARSMNRASGKGFDVQNDHVDLLQRVMARLNPGGKIFFLTHYRTFALDIARLSEGRSLKIKDLTLSTTCPDFERSTTHRCWLIET
jgi:23S rRNA (guanine2445-N2)-methyltransferase / 23S rRNA (guanine2069-N7)-methyltransferase